jgi:hypothetical protein
MGISGKFTHTTLDDKPLTVANKIPTPEEIFPVPESIIRSIVEIAPKIQSSGAWWAVGGDLSENVMGVHVQPTEIEILTDTAGLKKIFEALSSYNPSTIATRERRLDREADLDLHKYPVLERSNLTEFTIHGVKVMIKGDCQLKVGDWEWGDPFYFDPDFINIAGINVPVMPLSIRSEIYITLGWLDGAALISDAFTKAHTHFHEPPPSPKT